MPFMLPRPARIVDVNIFLDRWPFRRLPCDDTSLLVKKLRSHNVALALAGSFDALLHRDLRAVNQRLFDTCTGQGGDLLRPMGAVNLTLPHWEQDVEDCAGWGFPGVRIFPAWHRVPFSDERMKTLCRLCEEKGLLLQVYSRMEDPRTEHPSFQTQPVDFKPALELFSSFPKLRVLFSNSAAEIRPPQAAQFAQAGQIYFDISMIEQTGGVATYAAATSPDRLVYGSYFPYFYFEAALLKLQENEAILGKHVIDQIASANADRLITGKA